MQRKRRHLQIPCVVYHDPWKGIFISDQTGLSKQKVSTSPRRFCSGGAEMFEHVEKLRAGLRNLAVVSQSSYSSEREIRRGPLVFSKYYLYWKLSFLLREKERERVCVRATFAAHQDLSKYTRNTEYILRKEKTTRKAWRMISRG